MPVNGYVQKYYQRTQTVDGTTDTAIITATDQYDVDVVTLHIKNEHASVAFDACKLDIKAHPDAGWVNVEATGWATADNIVLSATNPATLAGGAETIIKFRTDGAYAWRILANGNAGATGPVEVWGVGKGVETVVSS